MLKLSGEMLRSGSEAIAVENLELLAGEIASVVNLGVEIAVVIGGGNIFRGAAASGWEMERASADYMGMIATVVNGLALQGILETKYQIYSRVMSAISMQEVAEPYIRRKAIKHLTKKRVVIFVSGTGNPFFTTDTAASLRAREIGAEVIMKATKVDGVYDCDPMKNPAAKRYDKLSYRDVLNQNLKVMDATAITMCLESKIPIYVFKLEKSGCVASVIKGQSIGTLVE
jgi:uridylate kinase